MPRGKAVNGKDTDGSNRSPRRQQRRTQQARVEFAGWVNVSIPNDHREAVTTFGADSRLFDSLSDLLQSGHKVTLSWTADEEVFVAATFMNDDSSPCAGLMVSQRSEDSWRALVKLLYVHAELLPPDYSELVGAQNDRW